MTVNAKPSARESLIHALIDLLHKKTFYKISVNELCAAAQVSRSAFYSHFDDKYDLFSCCLEEQTKKLDLLMETHSPEEFLTVILDFIQKEERFFYHTFGSRLDEELSENIYLFFEKHLMSLLKEKMDQGLVLPGLIETVASFYLGGLTCSTLRWINRLRMNLLRDTDWSELPWQPYQTPCSYHIG